jgi:hypothetical protein
MKYYIDGDRSGKKAEILFWNSKDKIFKFVVIENSKGEIKVKKKGV